MARENFIIAGDEVFLEGKKGKKKNENAKVRHNAFFVTQHGEKIMTRMRLTQGKKV